MAGIFTHLPPHRLLSSKPVSPDDALSLLSEYILAAESDPALQPNAVLTESGPTTSALGTGTGLAIHNLKRVEAGLRGENLGVDLTIGKHGEREAADLQTDDAAERKRERKRRRSEIDEVNMGTDGWQDKEAYEQEQEEENIEAADIGNRVQAKHDGEEAEQNRIVNGITSQADKEARKKAKKERAKAEKKDREKKRQAAKDD